MEHHVWTDDEGVHLPTLVNAHTHCADAGARPLPGMTLEELVAPPDGLKHRYLRETPRERIVSDMREYAARSRAYGSSHFVDFREGGVDGCMMLREASPDGFVLGRPVSKEFDADEMTELVSLSDGVALPSLSDMDLSYVERCAECSHRAGKPFAIHVSERIHEDFETVLSLEPAFVVHMVQATRSDLKMCADAGVPVVVCPRSNAFFGLTPPLALMLECGVDVAYGTDNTMLCTPDLREEAILAHDILESQGADGKIALDVLADGSVTISKILGLRQVPVTLPAPDPDDPLSALGFRTPVK